MMPAIFGKVEYNYMTNNMTTGKPAKLILQFMIPTCLGNIFQQFYNLADSVVAGRFIGVDALAAIGSTTSLIFLVIGWLNGLTSGFSIMVAQHFGAGKYERMRRNVAMSIYLCLAFVLVMTIALEILNYPILRLMNAPDGIIDDTAGYMAVIYAGLFATAAYNGLAAVMRALGDSRSPLYFLIISAVINVLLDVAFIIWFGMGVEGCAYATVIAQAVSALLCFLYIVRKFDILKLSRADFRISFGIMGRLLSIGIPMGLQFSITAIGTIIVQGAVNVFGSVYIAGFSAAGKIQNIVSTVFVILVIHLFGDMLIHIFIDASETEVMSAARTYFRAVAWCYPFLGSIFLYRNALQGLGYGLMPMMGGVFELIARAVIVAAVAGSFGYVGVCLADPAAWLAALVPIVPYYFYKISRISRKETHGGRITADVI